MHDTLSIEAFPKSSPLRAALGDRLLGRLLSYIEPRPAARGEVIIGEADGGPHPTYLIMNGEVSVARQSGSIVHLQSGDAFGGLTRLPSRRAPAIVIATEDTLLGRLTPDAWQRFCEEEPGYGISLLRGLTAQPSRARSRSPLGIHGDDSPLRRDVVRVSIGKQEHDVKTAIPARELLPERVDERLVVAALFDGKAVSLTTPVTSACRVAPLTTMALDGQRFYRYSQALLMLEAAYQVDPNLQPRLSHSLGFAQRVLLDAPEGVPLHELASAINAKMQELVEADLPIIEEWCSVNEAREIFERRGWDDAAKQLIVWRSGLVKLVSYGEVYAVSPGPLLPSTRLIGQVRFVADGDVLLLVYGKEGGRPIVGSNGSGSEYELTPATGRFAAVDAFRQTGPAVDEQHRWLNAVGITSVGEFNQACIDGEVSQIIRISEGFQEKRIGAIADQLCARGSALKVVAVAGPSSSGKTTFIRRLKVQMQVNGLTPVELSLDDYYVDREDTPRDASGEYDYESLHALRLDLLDDHLRAIIAGEDVQTPRYDFPTGTGRPTEGPRIQLGPHDVLVLEGIHGLNPTVLKSVPDQAAFRIFVCPLTQLPFDPLSRVHVSDVRLLRRIVRDRHGRAATAADTIARWPSVREGERLHIFPFQNHADAVFDSSLIYELAVLKVYAERYLLEVHSDDPAYTTANRLLDLIGRFVAIYPRHVPPTSLVREFIGGSGFED